MINLGGWFARRRTDQGEASPPLEAPGDTIVMDVEAQQDPRRPPLTSPFLRPSFSQLGEDRTLWWIFENKRDGFYVDVGCNHPLNFSNTALLHLRNGWSGINVDLDSRSIALFEEARPHDCNIVAAVGREAGRVEATIFTHSSELNMLGALNAEFEQLPHQKLTVDMLPLAVLLERHVPEGRQIDFLNVDVEGHDHQVLSSNDWSRFKPTVIAVEVSGLDIAGLAALPIHALLTAEGYTLISHTVVTSIYRRRA